MNVLVLYFLDILFTIRDIAGPITVISATLYVLIALSLIIFGDEISVEERGAITKTNKYLGIIFVVCFSLNILIPSKKEALAIYVIPTIVNNTHVQELPDNALAYLNTLFKKEIAELELETSQITD
jgi:hypothetical protein